MIERFLGRLLVFEGIEGSGKTTQALRLAHRLEAAGAPVLLAREPGGTPLGEEVRRLLLTEGALRITPRAELLLFAAARAQLVETVLRPALAEGRTVVLDRFVYSTVAYQGHGRGVPIGVVKASIQLATGGLQADRVILVDLPVTEALRRKVGDLDRVEREDRAFHQQVRDGYLFQASNDPARWIVADGRKPPDDLENEIWTRLNQSPG